MLELDSPELEILLRRLMTLTGETDMEQAVAAAVAEKLNLLKAQIAERDPQSREGSPL